MKRKSVLEMSPEGWLKLGRASDRYMSSRGKKFSQSESKINEIWYAVLKALTPEDSEPRQDEP